MARNTNPVAVVKHVPKKTKPDRDPMGEIPHNANLVGISCDECGEGISVHMETAEGLDGMYDDQPMTPICVDCGTETYTAAFLIEDVDRITIALTRAFDKMPKVFQRTDYDTREVEKGIEIELTVRVRPDQLEALKEAADTVKKVGEQDTN